MTCVWVQSLLTSSSTGHDVPSRRVLLSVVYSEISPTSDVGLFTVVLLVVGLPTWSESPSPRSPGFRREDGVSTYSTGEGPVVPPINSLIRKNRVLSDFPWRTLKFD